MFQTSEPKERHRARRKLEPLRKESFSSQPKQQDPSLVFEEEQRPEGEQPFKLSDAPKRPKKKKVAQKAAIEEEVVVEPNSPD